MNTKGSKLRKNSRKLEISIQPLDSALPEVNEVQVLHCWIIRTKSVPALFKLIFHFLPNCSDYYFTSALDTSCALPHITCTSLYCCCGHQHCFTYTMNLSLFALGFSNSERELLGTTRHKPGRDFPSCGVRIEQCRTFSIPQAVGSGLYPSQLLRRSIGIQPLLSSRVQLDSSPDVGFPSFFGN